MASRIAVAVVFIQALLYLKFQTLEAQTWVQAGYWFYRSGFPISDINSALCTHLICAFADVNSSSYELSISSAHDQSCSDFTTTVKQKNPSLTTLLSIAGGNANYTVLSLMVSNASSRESFIQSSMKKARLYGFQGLDLSWVSANTSSDMSNMGRLFEEWRAAAKSEAENSGKPELILTAAVPYTPDLDFASYPLESILSNLNWIHVMAYDYHTPRRENFTGAQAALYDPSSDANTDYGIKRWIGSGISANKLVLSLPFYGYAWTLRNPKDNATGAPATGPAITEEGYMSYKVIKAYIQTRGAKVQYNATYVVNYCSIGSVWIGFDDVEVVKIKVSYAREKDLLGYVVWQVSHDDNWVLSSAAGSAEGVGNKKDRRRLLILIILSTTASVILLLGVIIYCRRKKILRLRGMANAARDFQFKINKEAAGPFHSDAPDLQVYRFSDIEAATNRFSYENKLGQGGYGPVYKGILADGQEIAVKKLSKSSTQGFEEFKNEVTLTARLQHVNLVRVLGFCIEREEQMLIYEFMPNKSLDFYLFDPIRKLMLDWKKRVGTIEGIIQGLLYLQEYSRFTIIHRDLKANNILLDREMKPKISDFGMARIFSKDEQEANTSKIVGTYGYVPPEYVHKGLYSTKFDVYSFGVLLLQIISGKKIAGLYGQDEDLKLLDYAYELWKEGKGMEFVDPSLDDTSSPCKLTRCMQIALLCVQENAIDRPSMLEVSSMLRNESNSVAIPKKPAFSKIKDGGEANKCQKLEICSVNDATLSQIVGR